MRVHDIVDVPEKKEMPKWSISNKKSLSDLRPSSFSIVKQEQRLTLLKTESALELRQKAQNSILEDL